MGYCAAIDLCPLGRDFIGANVSAKFGFYGFENTLNYFSSMISFVMKIFLVLPSKSPSFMSYFSFVADWYATIDTALCAVLVKPICVIAFVSYKPSGLWASLNQVLCIPDIVRLCSSQSES
jgi:hypothetical protein